MRDGRATLPLVGGNLIKSLFDVAAQTNLFIIDKILCPFAVGNFEHANCFL